MLLCSKAFAVEAPRARRGLGSQLFGRGSGPRVKGGLGGGERWSVGATSSTSTRERLTGRSGTSSRPRADSTRCDPQGYEVTEVRHYGDRTLVNIATTGGRGPGDEGQGPRRLR